MSKTKFFAIDPQGVEHLRTSENRIYTHTVVVLRGEAYAARQLIEALDHATSQAPKDYVFHQSMVDGTWYTVQHPQWIDQRNDAEAAKHAAEIADLTVEGYVQKCLKKVRAQHDARHDAGLYAKWHNVGWCGRHDLAQKLADQTRKHGFQDVVILEAQVKQPKR